MTIFRKTLPKKYRLKNNKKTGDILKGIAIVAVLINHYIDRYISVYGGGIANVMVSIFFILSGYGIAISLEKKLKNNFSVKKTLFFYIDRILRIFPLFWIALLIQSLVTDRSFSISSFLGYELPGHYWFISAILQCYIFSILLFYLIKVNKYIALLFVTFIIAFSQFLGSKRFSFDSILMFFHLAESPYLDIYFIHTYLFFCGMLIQYFNFSVFINRKIISFFLKHYRFILILLFFIAIFYTFLEKYLLGSLPIVGSLILFFIACSFALNIKATSERNIFKILEFLGYHSFSIYLFHMSYYFVLEEIGIIEKNSTQSIVATIILLPVFILISSFLEILVSFISRKLRRQIIQFID